jgi:response regulator RpfG family c-di-GMP phosphodiesterase
MGLEGQHRNSSGNPTVEETQEIAGFYRKHKIRILKANHHYSKLHYSELLSKEVLTPNQDETIDEADLLKSKFLTRETLNGIIQLNLKQPIEAYLVLRSPLSFEDLATDIERIGQSFFQDSRVNYGSVKPRLKKYAGRLKEEQVVLNQLSLLRAENPSRYTDMIRTGILNVAIESRFTEDDQLLEDCLLAGVLHDIGFLYLDERYNGKGSGKFTINDLKKIQSHSELGYHLLKPWFHDNILNAAINHHVGEDRSGYPRQQSLTPNRLSSLTCFSSAFVSCLRKYQLHKAMKIQEIYSREQSHSGEPLKPFFNRQFYQTLEDLDIRFNQEGGHINLGFCKKYAVLLHNFLVYIHDLGREINKIDQLLLNYIRDNAAHRLDLQNDIDDVFDHIKKLNIIIHSCGTSPGLRSIMTDKFMASKILGDIEIISMELHRNNRFLIGLFSYLNSKIKDPGFEASIFKKALDFSHNIKRNISSHIEKDVSIFDMFKAS